MLSSEDLLRQALEKARVGDRNAAKVILRNAIQSNRDDAPTWFLLSQIADTPGEAAYYLGQMLRIEPGNALAKQRLEKLPVLEEPKPEPLPEEIPPQVVYLRLIYIVLVVVVLLTLFFMGYVLISW